MILFVTSVPKATRDGIVARIQIRKDEVKQVIRKVDRAQSLQEWKNQEINRLLLEKFNLGVNKK